MQGWVRDFPIQDIGTERGLMGDMGEMVFWGGGGLFARSS